MVPHANGQHANLLHFSVKLLFQTKLKNVENHRIDDDDVDDNDDDDLKGTQQ